MAKITALPDAAHRLDVTGGWVRMRPMSIDDIVALAEADTTVGPALRAVLAACVESHFDDGQPLGSQGFKVLTEILKAWNSAEDEVALPPANGQSSASPS